MARLFCLRGEISGGSIFSIFSIFSIISIISVISVISIGSSAGVRRENLEPGIWNQRVPARRDSFLTVAPNTGSFFTNVTEGQSAIGPALPLPAAFWPGLLTIGGMAVVGGLRMRRRTV